MSDDYREVGLLPHELRETFDAPEGDPRKRGTITCAAPVEIIGPIEPTPAPPDHPARRGEPELLQAVAGDLVVARDLTGGLASLYEEERERRIASEALRDYDPRRPRP